jgi:hypothetical protein
MAVTDAYETAANYRAAIDKVDTGEDAEVLTDLTAVSRYMERRLGRFFTKDASAVDRYYIGTGYRELYVDDLVSVTSIKIDTDRDGSFADETALATTDYELLPRNAAAGSEPAPYSCIYIPDWSTKGVWTSGAKVNVNGVFGWPAVPEAIKRGCIHLTAILRLETPRASATVSEIGQLVQMSPKAVGIIDDLIRHYSKVTL